MKQDHKKYIERNRQRFLKELADYLSIPSVSTSPLHEADVSRAVSWMHKHLISIGLEHVQLLKTRVYPGIYADFLHAKDQPTVLIYGHYDVQPADPLNEWDQSNPFKAVVKNGAIFARGATDNKGQHFSHIKAIESLLKTAGTLPVNVKLILEGEEEIGSVHAPEMLKSHANLLKADIAVLSDGTWISQKQPSLCIGMRGLMGGEIHVQCAKSDMHSGSYGGLMPNAAMELAQIVSKLRDLKTGKVLIPHFYDSVSKPPKKAYQGIDVEAGFILGEALADTGASGVIVEKGYSPRESSAFRPTFDINGFVSGFSGEGTKTIIPCRAAVKFTSRLALGQNPDDVFNLVEAYVKKIAQGRPISVEVRKTVHGVPAYLGPRNSVYCQAAVEAMWDAFSKKPVVTVMGALVGMVYYFKSILGIETLLMDIGLPDDHLHAPNEKFSLDHFYRGIDMSINFMERLSKKDSH